MFLPDCIVTRVLQNDFYILYKRKTSEKNINKYVIYRSENFGYDYFQDYKYLSEAKKMFNILTKEAIEHKTILERS